MMDYCSASEASSSESMSGGSGSSKKVGRLLGMYFSPVNWDNLSPAALTGDSSTADVPLGDADGVSYANEDNAHAWLGLGSDLVLDSTNCCGNSSLD